MNALVVYCHPLTDSFIGAARDRVVAGLTASGHSVRMLDLYADDFDPVMSRTELERYMDGPTDKPGIGPSVEALLWCDTLVLVYPTWWSGQPAMLKGWFDRVLVRDVAWELPEGAAHIRPRLTNIRRVVAVTTHGSSKLVNAVEGESGKRVITRSLRSVCGPRLRTSWIAMYTIDRANAAKRTAFLERIDDRMRRL